METSSRNCALKFFLTTGFLAGAFWFYIRFRRTLLSTYVKVGHVSKIICYPVTSCGGISEDNALCTRLGLSMLNFTDREFIVGKATDPSTTEQYESETLRDIQVFVNGRNLLLKFGNLGDEKITVKLKKDRQACTIQCLGMEIDAMDCGQKVATWLSESLQEANLRLFDCKYSWAIESRRFRNVGCVVVTEESITEINRLFKFVPPLTVDYFRPNIVISGTQPFDEHNWDYVYIGNQAVLERRSYYLKLIEEAYDRANHEWRYECEPRDAMHGAVCLPYSLSIPEVGFNATVFREGRITVGDPVFVVYQPKFLLSCST